MKITQITVLNLFLLASVCFADIPNPGTYVFAKIIDEDGVDVRAESNSSVKISINSFVKISINANSTAIIDRFGTNELSFRGEVTYIPDPASWFDGYKKRLEENRQNDPNRYANPSAKKSDEALFKALAMLKKTQFEDGFYISVHGVGTYTLFRKNDLLISIPSDRHLSGVPVSRRYALVFKRG